MRVRRKRSRAQEIAGIPGKNVCSTTNNRAVGPTKRTMNSVWYAKEKGALDQKKLLLKTRGVYLTWVNLHYDTFSWGVPPVNQGNIRYFSLKCTILSFCSRCFQDVRRNSLMRWGIGEFVNQVIREKKRLQFHPQHVRLFINFWKENIGRWEKLSRGAVPNEVRPIWLSIVQRRIVYCSCMYE